jgi:lipopolysaccharide export system permease protein
MRWLKGLNKISFGKQGLWSRGGEGIYNIREIDLEKNILRGVTLYELDGFRLKGLTHARTVEWEDGRWIGREARGLTFMESYVVDEPKEGDTVFQGLRGPEELVTFEKSYADMGFRELGHYISGLEKDGYNTDRYRVELYSRISFPLVSFIMVLVGIPFALRAGRHGGIAAGVALSVVIGFSYWIIFGVTKSLGQSGVLPPIIAAAFPDILFVAIGALMFGYVRQ